MFKGLLKVATSTFVAGAAYTAGVLVFDRVVWPMSKKAGKRIKGTYKIIRIKKGEA